jgi:ATP-dependent Zn protease
VVSGIRAVDDEVLRLIETAHDEVTQPMSANVEKLDTLAEALLEHDTLEQNEA